MKAEILASLKSDIHRLQGRKPAPNPKLDSRLSPLIDAFPDSSFPLGAIHEFLSSRPEDFASTHGFISGLLSSLMSTHGTTLWISTSRKLFPPALKNFGLSPDRFIFIDLQKEKDALWTMEEALKCPALTTVITEIKDISFTDSRRLQLAVEQSQVTGFILRNNPRNPTTTACVSRWKITPLESQTPDDLPGIGFPAWRVELLRIRNGKPGMWDIQWCNNRFVPVYKSVTLINEQQKVG